MHHITSHSIASSGGRGHLVEGDDDQQVEARGSQGREQPRLGEEEGLGAVVAREPGESPVEERDPEEDDGHQGHDDAAQLQSG